MDPDLALLLLISAIIGVLSTRALVDYFVEPGPVARRWLNAVAAVLVLAGIGCLVLLAVAVRHDPSACPFNGCS